jgi:ABC-2 type transport system permease protein
MRAVLMSGSFKAEFFWSALALNAVYLAVGCALYLAAIHWARREGRLLQMGE